MINLSMKITSYANLITLSSWLGPLKLKLEQNSYLYRF